MLTVDPIVKISMVVGAATSVSTVYDVGLILGTSSVISATDRVKSYASLADMASAGFDAEDEEYTTAEKYFGVSPAPASVLVGVMDEGETPVQALTAVLSKTNRFYGVYVCGATAQQIADVDTFLLALNRCVQFYGVIGTVDAAVGSSSTFSVLASRKSKRALGLYSAAVEDAAAVMGMAMGLARTHTTDAFALCYKHIASIDVMPLTQDNVDDLKDVNANVYIARGYTRTMLENGATASGLRYDEVLYLDMMAADMQDACLALIADRSAKLPQNDTTSTLFINALSGVLNGYRDRGVLAPGEWNGSAAGGVANTSMLQSGFSIHVNSYSEQSQVDREAHKAMPITVRLCLAGSVESVEMTVYVQR